MKVTFDEKRCGYFVGDNKDQFFVYFTCDGNEPSSYLEFDVEKWNGIEFNSHFQIPIGLAKKPSCDLVETLVSRELNAVGAP